MQNPSSELSFFGPFYSFFLVPLPPFLEEPDLKHQYPAL
jgi:hypothetical protein